MATQLAAAQLNFFPSNRMNPATGYGKMELGILSGLMATGAKVAMVDQFTAPTHNITLVTGSPEWGEGVPGRKWVFTMSESTRVSKLWVGILNAQFERVLVPCPPLVDIYRDSGVTIPVDYVPLGVDYKAPAFVARDPEPAQFTWLTYSLGDMRKGADLAIMAFKRVCGDDPRYRLIIKCRDEAQWLTGLDDPQIELAQGQMDESAWHDLLRRCHAMIFPSRGEGFGLPPREAALSGMPVAATQALGMWDVEKWGYPIPVKGMRPCQFDYYEANDDGALWWEPDWGTLDPVAGTITPGPLDAQMRAIMADYPAALAQAQRGRDYLLTYFTWEQVARQITDLLMA